MEGFYNTIYHTELNVVLPNDQQEVLQDHMAPRNESQFLKYKFYDKMSIGERKSNEENEFLLTDRYYSMEQVLN